MLVPTNIGPPLGSRSSCVPQPYLLLSSDTHFIYTVHKAVDMQDFDTKIVGQCADN